MTSEHLQILKDLATNFDRLAEGFRVVSDLSEQLEELTEGEDVFGDFDNLRAKMMGLGQTAESMMSFDDWQSWEHERKDPS